jgi:hypothetical protein
MNGSDDRDNLRQYYEPQTLAWNTGYCIHREGSNLMHCQYPNYGVGHIYMDFDTPCSPVVLYFLAWRESHIYSLLVLLIRPLQALIVHLIVPFIPLNHVCLTLEDFPPLILDS